MGKKWIIIFLVFLFSLSFSENTYADDSEVKVIIDGEPLALSVSPIIKNGSTLVPLRDIFDFFDAKIEWDQETMSVKATKDNTTLWIIIDSNVAFIDGEAIELFTPAILQNSRTLVPLRFISEAFNSKVSWDGKTQTVTIKTGEKVKIKQPDQNNNNSKIKKIVTGRFFSMALKEDGTLTAWGSNHDGTFGDGTNKNRIFIESVGNKKEWKDVAAGEFFVVLLKKDGSLWTLGHNEVGELGDGTTKSRYYLKQIGNSNQWESVYAGYYQAAAIKKDGTLWMWGYNSPGTLGDGTRIDRTRPVKVAGKDWAMVSPGYSHTVAIKRDGTLWSWGYNINGQLGIGNSTKEAVLTPKQIGKDKNWKAISAGGNHTLALKKDGTLWAWGSNTDGEMGNGLEEFGKYYSSPTRIGKDSDWVAIGRDRYNVYGIKKDGTLWVWGSKSLVPKQIGKDRKWVSVSQSPESMHILGKASDGKVYAWGLNLNLQLGNAEVFERTNVPTKVTMPGM